MAAHRNEHYTFIKYKATLNGRHTVLAPLRHIKIIFTFLSSVYYTYNKGMLLVDAVVAIAKQTASERYAMRNRQKPSVQQTVSVLFFLKCGLAPYLYNRATENTHICVQYIFEFSLCISMRVRNKITSQIYRISSTNLSHSIRLLILYVRGE